MTYTQQLVEGLIALSDKSQLNLHWLSFMGNLHMMYLEFMFFQKEICMSSFDLIISSANAFIMVTEWKIRFFFTECLSLLAYYGMLLTQ